MSMRIVLATGIYPPQIGGPATYVHNLARELSARGVQVVVVSYSPVQPADQWQVIGVQRHGCFLQRWWRYAHALRTYALDADVVYAFSSISCGIPLLMARLPSRARKVLRLGGDFLWERYTDRGGRKSLREWYRAPSFGRVCMRYLLRRFDHLIYSTAFQREVYASAYRALPHSSVIENAIPGGMLPRIHTHATPFRLLTFSRLVRFKNIDSLIRAMVHMPECLLTIVGEGPDKRRLQYLAHTLHLDGRVAFVDVVPTNDTQELFALHEALIIPSLTDISPNSAIEARSAGLPVLLTSETGLSENLSKGMILAPLQTPAQIVKAIEHMRRQYPADSTHALPLRMWADVANEHIALFRSLS